MEDETVMANLEFRATTWSARRFFWVRLFILDFLCIQSVRGLERSMTAMSPVAMVLIRTLFGLRLTGWRYNCLERVPFQDSRPRGSYYEPLEPS